VRGLTHKPHIDGQMNTWDRGSPIGIPALYGESAGRHIAGGRFF